MRVLKILNIIKKEMPAGICVFDLDNTLGDFRGIDYFGYIFEPKLLLEPAEVLPYMEKYGEKIYMLRDMFENFLDEIKIPEMLIFRPKIVELLTPLVEAYKTKKVQGFYMYSNNNNPYALEYAGRYLERQLNILNIFKIYLHRTHKLRPNDLAVSKTNPPKLVQTVLDLIPEIDNPNIIFFDDLEHPDFRKNNVTYVKLLPFETKATTDDLEDIWKIFVQQLELVDFDIFELPHVQKLGRTNLETLHKDYIQYSNDNTPYKGFVENTSYIENLIQTFLKGLSNVGGKRKNFTKRYKKNRSKKRRYLLKHERSNSIDV